MSHRYIYAVFILTLLCTTLVSINYRHGRNWVEIGVVKLKADNDPFGDIYFGIITNEYNLFWNMYLDGVPTYTKSIYAYSNYFGQYTYVELFTIRFYFPISTSGTYNIQLRGTTYACINNWCTWHDKQFFYYSAYLEADNTYTYALYIPAYVSYTALAQPFIFSANHIIKTGVSLYVDNIEYSNWQISFAQFNSTTIYWQLTVNIDQSLNGQYVQYIRLVCLNNDVINAVNQISNIEHQNITVAMIVVNDYVWFGDTFTLGVYYVL